MDRSSRDHRRSPPYGLSSGATSTESVHVPFSQCNSPATLFEKATEDDIGGDCGVGRENSEDTYAVDRPAKHCTRQKAKQNVSDFPPNMSARTRGSPEVSMRSSGQENEDGTNRSHTAATWIKRVRSRCLTGIPLILLATLCGFILGICLSLYGASGTALSWVDFPGQLFLRTLKALVVPLIFSNLVTVMGDLFTIGDAGTVSLTTISLYMLTTLLASAEGLLLAMFFKRFYSQSEVNVEEPKLKIQLGCGRGLLSYNESTGLVSCRELTGPTDSLASERNTTFIVEDVNNLLIMAGNAVVKPKTVSQTIQDLFFTIFNDNIVRVFAENIVLSVAAFGMLFGVALAVYKPPRGQQNILQIMFRQLNDVVLHMVTVVIYFTPMAIVSLVASAIGGQNEMGSLMKNVGIFLVSVWTGIFFHAMVSLPALYYIFIRSNPFTWLYKMSPVVLFAFACSSSIACVPVSQQHVEKTGTVIPSLARFVLSLGATINMDGAAVYYPPAITFIACVAGYGDQMDSPAVLLTLLLASTFGAVGASPIPTPGLVNILMIWQATFPQIPPPPHMVYLLALDWLNDRGSTALNVLGDTVVARVVSAKMTSRKKSYEETNEEAPWTIGKQDTEEEATKVVKEEKHFRTETNPATPYNPV